MDYDKLLQMYLSGELDIMDKLGNEEKIKYYKLIQLLDETLKSINEVIYNIHLMGKVRRQMKLKRGVQ